MKKIKKFTEKQINKIINDGTNDNNNKNAKKDDDKDINENKKEDQISNNDILDSKGIDDILKASIVSIENNDAKREEIQNDEYNNAKKKGSRSRYKESIVVKNNNQ